MINLSGQESRVSKRACFERIYIINKQIRAGKYPNTAKLAELLEVKPRTIERDIEHMRDRLGADIEYDRGRKGYYYASNDFQLPPLKMSESEAIALFLGHKLLIQCAGTPFESIIRSAFEKICSQLPVGMSIDTFGIDKTVSFDVAPLRGDEKELAAFFGRLAVATNCKTTVWIKYFSPSRVQTTQRNVDPYHLRYFEGAWYLIGYCHLRNQIRIFAIDRIIELNETNQHFDILPNFSLEEFFSGSMGIEAGSTPVAISIRFDSYQARYIRERRWHESQIIEEKDDGSLILNLEVSGLGEVKRWILGFGSHAEVLFPESLRNEMKEEIRNVGEMYHDGKISLKIVENPDSI